MRHQPADKSQINRRPCFLSPTLGTDTTKYHLPKRDRLTCLGLDITDIRARFIHQVREARVPQRVGDVVFGGVDDAAVGV